MDYDEQLSAAKFRAERDMARQECERLRARLRDSVPRDAYERKRTKWLRQIRECEAALHRRREYIKKLEGAALERRTVREEDREAAEWVRGHGGLDSVKKLLDWMIDHCSTKQQLDFDFWLSGRVMHELGFDEDMADREEVERRLLARLMPEGCEWPRYESGELVRIGGCWGEDGCDTSITYIERIIFAEDGVYLDNDYKEAFYRHGERVKRPAPKVLDADGVEIRAGDTVWLTDGRGPWSVSRTVYADRLRVICDDEKNGHLNAYPEMLTHRAPALAADGKPLRVGEMVWDCNGDGYVVERIYSGTTEPDFPGHTVACRRPDDIVTHMFKPSQLTHTKPEIDTWERIEDDAVKDCWDYWGCEMYLCTEGCPNEVDGKPPYKRLGVDDCSDAQTLDLVRRCKELARKEKTNE